MNDLDFNKYIGARIRKKRKAMGLSLQQLAEVLKLSTQQVQKYESGASKVSAERLALISHIFSEPIDYFYRDIDFNSITIGDSVQPTVINSTRNVKLDIMLVEDSPADAMLFKRAAESFSEIGEITIEHHANKVMPYLLNHQQNPNHKLPDILFLDISLTAGNGFDLLKKIKDDHSLRHLVVAIISGSINWEDMMKAYRMGAASYILKSSKDRPMSELLESVLEYWSHSVILPSM